MLIFRPWSLHAVCIKMQLRHECQQTNYCTDARLEREYWNQFMQQPSRSLATCA